MSERQCLWKPDEPCCPISGKTTPTFLLMNLTEQICMQIRLGVVTLFSQTDNSPRVPATCISLVLWTTPDSSPLAGLLFTPRAATMLETSQQSWWQQRVHNCQEQTGSIWSRTDRASRMQLWNLTNLFLQCNHMIEIFTTNKRCKELCLLLCKNLVKMTWTGKRGNSMRTNWTFAWSHCNPGMIVFCSLY